MLGTVLTSFIFIDVLMVYARCSSPTVGGGEGACNGRRTFSSLPPSRRSTASRAAPLVRAETTSLPVVSSRRPPSVN
ncbi:hypothetical protein J6590_018665 [Homalodisca vitripennis]|nr:hypothetical protein J6590_018665 [Homalodisca vitripennis]